MSPFQKYQESCISGRYKSHPFVSAWHWTIPHEGRIRSCTRTRTSSPSSSSLPIRLILSRTVNSHKFHVRIIEEPRSSSGRSREIGSRVISSDFTLKQRIRDYGSFKCKHVPTEIYIPIRHREVEAWRRIDERYRDCSLRDDNQWPIADPVWKWFKLRNRWRARYPDRDFNTDQRERERESLQRHLEPRGRMFFEQLLPLVNYTREAIGARFRKQL